MNPQGLRQLFVLSNRFKEGDVALGGTTDPQINAEACREVASLTVGTIDKSQLLEDGVTEALRRSEDRTIANEISSLTLGEIKEILLSDAGNAWVTAHRDGLSSLNIAGIVKMMTEAELSFVARSLFNPIAEIESDQIGIGSPGHFGSRIQPNSPGDDENEILLSILEGLTFGCGDVILGLNPASDDVETIIRLEDLLRSVVERLRLPTRYCVLSDLVKQTTARERTRVDVAFQSLAGTSAALLGMVGLDVDGIVELSKGFDGLYFETGQGSELTNGVEGGVDMVTLESRTYGVARAIAKAIPASNGQKKWMIVNDVAGFIGPEVFRTTDQLRRACIEDAVMAKLHGLTMGLDVCATFHMGIEPSELRRVTARIVSEAAPAYLMAVAGNADPMLGYMTTSFRDHPLLRQQTGKQFSTLMQRRLIELGVSDQGSDDCRNSGADFYAAYMKAGGESRSVDALQREGATKLAELQSRGFDLGYGSSAGSLKLSEQRMSAIYDHARLSLFATIEESVIADMCPSHALVRSLATDRDRYLSHPSDGEQIRPEDESRITSLYSSRRPAIQLVVSDGLNANAINENLRLLLPPLRRQLNEAGIDFGEPVVVIKNGRVRAGYHVGALLEAELIIHLIGERPGTGLNMLSAYLTYGRDRNGRIRWSRHLDHSLTTAICGIHRAGKDPLVAAGEIAKVVRRIIDQRTSGVELGRSSV